MEEKKWIVYLYTCDINGKQYVGKTCNKYGMKGRAKNGKGYGRGVFHNAIEKYGWGKFSGEILKNDLSVDEANYWETYYIRKYRTCIDYEDCNGYNMTEGGDGGEMLGYHHTDESKEKISKAFKGRFVGELNPMYGVHNNHICDENGHLPKEIREKLSKAAKNRITTNKEFAEKMQSYNEERKRKVNQYDLNGIFIKQYESITEAGRLYGTVATIWRACTRYIDQKGCHIYTAYGYQWRFADDCDDIGIYRRKPVSEYNRKNKKAVCQYSLNGEYINTYSSIREASRITKTNASMIGSCCSGKNHTANGFLWKYKTDKNIPKYIARKKNINGKPVNQLDLNGNFIKTFPSQAEAGRELGINSSNISMCCTDMMRTAGGFKWEYAC